MKVFVTGSSGYIGRTVTRRLVEAGHHVTSLVRSARAAEVAKGLGANTVEADLAEPAAWQTLAWPHDAAIHMAQEHSGEGVKKDWQAIETLLRAGQIGSVRHFIYTSGVWVLGPTPDGPADETASTERAAAAVTWRPDHERQALASPDPRVRTAVVRPGIVYGGKGGLVDLFFETAEQDGAAAFIGDGSNRWSLVHLEDLADLYLLLLEKHAAGIYHAVDGSPTRVRELATQCSHAAGRNGAVRSVALSDARRQMGPMADALVMDQVVSAPASAALGWKPARRAFDAQAAFQQWKEA